MLRGISANKYIIWATSHVNNAMESISNTQEKLIVPQQKLIHGTVMFWNDAIQVFSTKGLLIFYPHVVGYVERGGRFFVF